jgi:citrate synthase
MEKIEISLHKGLREIYFDTSEASLIDGEDGILLYRGFNIHDLAELSNFEEVVYLLLYGELPTSGQLDDLNTELRSHPYLPPQIIEILRVVKGSKPMDVLRTGVSAIAQFDPEGGDDSPEAVLRKGIRLTSQAPSIVGAHHRIRSGLDPVEPRDDLDHAASFLHGITGEIPDAETSKLLDVGFISHAEHGANASAFVASVAASTMSDYHSSIVSAIGTLKGPLHGGAEEHVMPMAEEIDTPEHAEGYGRDVIDHGGRIMGFGPRIYKVEDPRARHPRDRSRSLGERSGQPRWYQILHHLQANVMALYQSRGIYMNVGFYSGSIYNLLGIPQGLFIPIFALGRLPGWTLQVLEQLKNNILIRPLLAYSGPDERPYIPLGERG